MVKRQDGAREALVVIAMVLLGVWARAVPAAAQSMTPTSKPTVDEAQKFVEEAEARLIGPGPRRPGARTGSRTRTSPTTPRSWPRRPTSG